MARVYRRVMSMERRPVVVAPSVLTSAKNPQTSPVTTHGSPGLTTVTLPPADPPTSSPTTTSVTTVVLVGPFYYDDTGYGGRYGRHR
jgi:hypothetical protein